MAEMPDMDGYTFREFLRYMWRDFRGWLIILAVATVVELVIAILLIVTMVKALMA